MTTSYHLTLYNSLTREKAPFTPLDASNVRLYVCGPTVYDFAHIGNARPIIVFDLLFRLLRQLYGAPHVTYVRNITDVDDKINARAARDFPDLPLNESIKQVTEKTTLQFHADITAVGALPPTVEPRATDHIEAMITIIERLISRGHAYAAEGHVLFDVSSMPAYGALAKRTLDDMQAGARVDVAPYKRGEMDFVLWKPSAATAPGWDSPWGFGRPGWHIECSAMSWQHLGETFDIHGGGIDLIFPHHENEVAQSCFAFNHERMASVWMHNGFLQVEGAKMSKSLGNFITINELLATENFGGRSWPGAVLRLAMLKTHYRAPIDWTVKALEEAEANLQRWHEGFDKNETAGNATPPDKILTALCDDLNSSEAIAELHALRKTGNKAALKSALTFLGLFQPNVFGQKTKLLSRIEVDAVSRAKIDTLVSARIDARQARDWAKSDSLRDELVGMGVVLQDGKDADGALITDWELKA